VVASKGRSVGIQPGATIGPKLTRPGARLAKLRGLRRNVVGEARVAKLNDLAANLNDAPKALRAHVRERSLRKEQRRLDEELQLVEVRLPGLLLDGQHGLMTGGVEDKDVDRPKRGGDFSHEFGDGGGVADVGLKGLGDEAIVAETGTEFGGAVAAGEVVDRNAMPSLGKRNSHRRAQAAGSSGDEGGAGHRVRIAGSPLRLSSATLLPDGLDRISLDLCIDG